MQKVIQLESRGWALENHAHDFDSVLNVDDNLQELGAIE